MIRSEFYKQFRRLRTWIAFGCLAGLPILVAIANRAEGRPGPDASAAEQGIFIVSSASGFNHALAALAFMSPFFLVVVVANFAGESIAGEANWGTLRYLLVRPVTRTRLLFTKLGVVFGFALAATATIAISGLISGGIAFGFRAALTPLFNELSVAGSYVKLAESTLYVASSMIVVISFGVFLSTLTDVPGGATAGAIGLAVVSQILNSLPSLDFLHVYLPTHYWNAWFGLFLPNQGYEEITKGIVVQLVYLVVFGGLALWRFRRKDVLS